ncbi:uncharacterized protein LOC132277901 [Cornus florida]|uniref:uncharacterized protein LOC132277901 n=1 Tax=Cornus florida TaxID=4283 RepID=UPI00289A3390|nr:uncharacterized protein LOC132277901 [Cornus florida]
MQITSRQWFKKRFYIYILGNRVKRKIREEVGDAKFCILVDEAQDLSNTEQMAFVLRFVDKNGLLRERFFGVVGVKDTTALTLKKEISNVLALYDLQVDSMRGQGYDGASNMATGELQSGKGANQIKTLQRAGATRWSSHFGSISSLIDLFGPSRIIIENISKNGPTNSIRGEAKGVYLAMLSFEFVFILHLLREMMGITDILCQALQRKTQDIVNAMNLVSSRSCQQNDSITFNHHYQVDIFNAAIDFQLMKLNQRFSESTAELLILGIALDPKVAYKSFKVDDINDLVGKFYPKDFQDEMRALRSQLEHYKIDVLHHPTTTERAFSVMKRVKTKLHNKMADEFLADCMILNIERELTEDIDIDSVVNEFDSLKDRRVHLQ